MFVGDALAMPVHWYYDVAALQRDFGTIRDYRSPNDVHPNSIMSLASTGRAGRGSQEGEVVGSVILKGKKSFWGRPNTHYHRGRRPGDNTLNFAFNPFFFRPDTYGADAAGTLILVNSTGFSGFFENFTGVLTDYIGFTAAPGSGTVVGTLGTSTLNPLTDIPANTYYFEQETDTGNLLFHYRLTATIPEPASAGLMAAGLILLRVLGRRRKS